MKDHVADLYRALVNGGYNVDDLGGSIDGFREAMSDSVMRKEFYDWVGRRGNFRLPDYDAYESALASTYDGLTSEAIRQRLQEDGTIDRMKEAKKEARQNKRKGFWNMFGSAPAQTSFLTSPEDRQRLAQISEENAQKSIAEYSQNKLLQEKLDVALDMARAGENQDGLRGVENFGLGLWDSATRLSTWDFGYSDIVNNLTLQQIVEKWENDPSSLTATEKKVLDGIGMATAVQELYSDQVGVGYNVGQSLTESASFMMGMALNPASGLGKSLARNAVRTYGRNSIVKNLARIGGDIAETAIMTATTGAGRVAADALERINGSSTYEIGENGVIMYGGQKDQETVGNAVIKAIGANFIENYSEALGEYFDPLLGMSRKVAAGGLRKMNLNKWADALSDVQPSQMTASIRSLREKTKFGGIFGEIMEEEIGMALNAISGVGDYTFSKEKAEKEGKQWIFDLENQLTTVLSCAIMSGTLNGVEQVSNVAARRRMEKNAKNAEQSAANAFGEQFAELRENIDQASPEGMVDVLRDVYMDQGYSLEQKRKLAEYAAARLQMQYYNAADANARREINKTQQGVLDAYEAGRHAQLPTFYNIEQEYRNSEAAINASENAENIWAAIETLNRAPLEEHDMIINDFTEEEQQLIRQYRYNAARVLGAVNSRAEQAEDRIDEYRGQITPFIMPDGKVTTAILGDNVVFVMEQNENGDAVVYTNDGRKIFAKTRDLEHVETHNAEALIERFRQSTNEAMDIETEKNLSYPSEVQEPAQGVVVSTLDGKQWQVVATDGENVQLAQMAFDRKSGQWIASVESTRTMNREEFMDWQKAELDRKKANTYEQGDELTFYVNGEPISAEITGIDPDGNYYVHVSNLVEGLDKAVSDVYTAEELRKLTTPSSKVSEKTTENEGTASEKIEQSVSEEIADGQSEGAKAYTLSDEVDENGRQFVVAPNGSIEFGRISSETGLSEAPILLSEGIITNPQTNDGYGLVHIEARHGDQIRKAGYKSVVDFVEEVARNYEVIREGINRNGHQTYMLQLTDKHNNTLMVELSGDGTYWNINTAGIFKTSYGRNRKEVYNRHTTDKQSTETVGVSQNDEQGGTQSNSSMNTPTLQYSNTKGSGNVSGVQVNGQENAAEGANIDTSINKSAFERVPKDNKGNPIYEQTDADTAWDAIVEETEGDTEMAQRVAVDMLADKKAALAKLQNGKPKKGATVAEKIANEKAHAAAIAQAQNDVAQWEAIVGTEARRREAAMSEADRYAAEMEQKSINEGLAALGEPQSLEEYVLGQLAGGAYKLRWSDKENGTKGFGSHTGLSTEEMKARLSMIDNKNGLTPEEIAHSIVENMDASFGEVDVMDVTNMVIDAVSTHASRRSMFNGMVESRAELLRQQARAEQEAKDAWYMEQYHATEEELAAYNEYLAEFAKEIYGEDTDYEQRIATFAEIQLGEYDNQGTDAGLRSSADQGEGLTSDREGSSSVGETEQLDRRELREDAEGVAEAEDGRAGSSVSAQSDDRQSRIDRAVADYRENVDDSPEAIAAAERDQQRYEADMADDARINENQDDTTRRSIQESPTETDRVSGEIFGGESLGEGKSVSARGDGGILEEGAGKKKRTAKARRQSDNRQEARDGKAERLSRGISPVQQQAIDEYTRTNPWDANLTDDERGVLSMYRMATLNELDDLAHKLADKINSGKATPRDRMRYDVLAAYAKSGELKAVADAMGVEYDSPVSLDTIKSLFETFNSDPELAELFNRVFPLIKEINPTIVYRRFTEKDLDEGEDISPDDILGQYSLQENLIEYNRNQIDSNHCTEQEKASTIVHEMIHAVARYAIRVREARNEGVELGIQLPKRLLDAAQSLIEVYDAIKDNEIFNDDRYESGKMYGVSSVHEMLSELANPEFREKLKQVSIESLPSDKKGRVRDALRAIKDFLHRMFGWDSSSAYARTKRALDKLIDNYDSAGYNNARELADEDFAQLVAPSDNLRFRDGNNAELKEKYTDEQIFDAAKQKFGVTDDIREAGYILPDGSMLDFSGRYAVDGDASHLKGERHMDHREVNKIAYDDNGNETGLETNMTDFIERGAIRIHYSTGGVGIINLDNAPTKEQKAKLRQLISAHNGNMDVDFGNGWNTDYHAEYDKAKPTRILGDIDRYYSEGVRPEGNILYRDGAPFFSNAERAVENIKQQKATPEQWLAMIKKDGGLKAGEDKWMGLSDWLNEQKEKGVKTLTKDEVLQFIRENQIEVEEVEYSDNPIGFDELKEEYEAILREDGYDAAHEAMVDRFGDDFDIAFDDLGGELVIANEEAAATLLGSGNIINHTRLDYTTAGLENKREIALVVPTIEPWNQSDEIHFGDAGDGRAVAWVRFGEATDTDGNRVLVIDEVQSKRHDEGRAKGYSKHTKREEFRRLVDEMYDKYGANFHAKMTRDEEIEFDRLTNERIREDENNNSAVPDAPFDKNYHELVMKRMLRYAAENGFDKVAWTKGAQQAERYDLSNTVSSIEYKPLSNGHYSVTAYGTNGYPIGNIPSVYNSEQEIADVFGKEMAVKIVQGVERARQSIAEYKESKEAVRAKMREVDEDSAEYEELLEEFASYDKAISEARNAQTIEGEDLQIGGDGMKGYYDEMIPRFMNKYTKKWGTKVGEVTLPNVEEAGRTMWSVDVTPEMRESVMQGQPMFREGMGAISDREVSYENDPIAKFQGKPRYYGKKAAAFAERERRRMENAAKEAAEMLGIEAEIVTDASTLQGRKAKAKGWYDIVNKKVVVVVPNHVSMGDAVRTVLHEGIAHHGLRELFGDGFDAMLDNVYNNVSPELKARIDAIAERTGVSTSVATEEYMASLAETTNFEEAQRRGWWQQIKSYFVDMLRKLAMPGLKLKEEITDNELRYLLWRSYKNLVEPNSYLKPLGYAEDVVKQKELKVGEYAEKAPATPMAAEISEAEEWAAVTMQRIEELEAQAAQLENEIAEVEADRDADDAGRYEMWEQQLEPLRKQMEDVYAELEGLYNLEAEAEEMSMASEEGLRYRSKDSTRRQERNRINNNYENAVSLLFGIDKKKVREERIAREKKRREDAKEIYDSVLSGDFNDVTLRKINDYIDDATPRNPFGRRISQRLPQKLERSLHEGARTNAVDALFSRISESAVPANERISEAGRRKAEERKKELLKGWAIATGNWHTDLSAFVDDTTPIGEGTDSKVYLAKDGAHVIKASKGKPYGKRFRPDMDNIALFNRVFYNSRYEIVGYGEIDGEFVRILKQPIVDFTGTTPLTPEERVEYMKGLKFEPINDSKTAFSNGEIVISDLQKSNIIKDAAGNVRVIDADAKLHTKDVGGNYTYPPVEADLPQNEDSQEKEDIAIEDSANIESRNDAEIIAEVERESANLGVQVRIARSIDELPDEDTRKRAVEGKLKGYFDPRTGEVVLYEPNTENANDAKRTILHEIVGHKGLRQLIGEQRYDKSMLQLMYMLPADVRDAVLRRAERHGWNAAIAMDEYLAEQAERDVQPTWWGKVNAKIRALLRNLGFDVKLTDSDVTYLLWRSRKKLQGDDLNDMAVNAILKQAARKSVNYDAESDNAIRHRGVEQGKKISEAVSDYYEKYTATTNADKFWGGVKYMATHLGDGGTRALLNDLSESQFEDIRSVRVLEEAIESAEGKPLRENEMVHKSLNAKTSRDARDMDKSQTRYFQPMAKLLGKILGKKIDGRKIEIDDVERYLICKHSPENNEFLMKRAHAENRRKKIAERAKELMKGTMTEEEAIAQATSEYTLHQSDFRDDYSGLTELFPDEMVREAKIAERTKELMSNGVTEDTATQMAIDEFTEYKPTLEDREKMAADEVARFEATVDGLHEELWGIINGINRDTIERLFRSGLISRSLYNDLKKRHKFYVPLSGWKNDAAADIYNYAMYGFDGTPIQTVIKKAFGTKYQARNILGSMFAMNIAAITEGNQNLVKQKLYNLALNHDTGVLQIVDLWEVKDGEGDAAEWKPAPKPELRPTMSDAEMQNALTDYQNKLMEMEKDGKARKAVNSLADNFGKHTTDKEAKRHHVELLVNGRKVVIWVNGNPKLAQAINGDLTVKKELLFFDDAVDKANRFLAQMQTSLSPEFMISNFERDILSASRYNLIKYGPKYEASFMKHLAQLMPIVSETNADMRSDVWGGAGIFNLFALDRNTNDPNRKPDAQVLDMNNTLHREFVNFLNYGGKTGYVERKQAEDLQQRIKKLSKREQSIIRKVPAEVVGWVVDTIEHLNEGIENATRFAAYLTARERGKSVTEAVFEAKEVSVNFNMQGSGAWGNASYRKLYNYFNVGLQSLRREKNLGREFPKAYIANLAFMMALGAISTVLLTADWDGDDEDEYMGLSDFNRYNYINVKTENGFIHYSLPQDLRAFYAIGCISTEWAMGKIDSSRAMQAYATQANNYTPLSFVSTTIGREPDSNPVKNLAMSFVFSAAVPVAEIAVNEDFLGRRIHNRNQWNEYEPEWQRAGYRTPEWVINASKTLSEAGGGTEHKRGVWFTEINPSDAWHIMDSYGGGFLDFAQKTYNLVERVFAGKEHELRDYPMVSKFYVESGQDYSKQRVVNDRYRMYREDYETIDNELNGYLKDKSNALRRLSARAKEEELPESVVNKERAEIEKTYEDNVKRVKEYPNYWIYESFVPYEKEYNNLNSNLGKARKYGSEQTEKVLSGEMYNVRKKLVDEIDAKRERPIDRVRQWLGN